MLFNISLISMKGILSFIYQWFVFTPILVITSIVTAILVMLGCSLGYKTWGYTLPKYWSKIICYTALCKIKVRKSKLVKPNASYVFIANHQGAFDIFLTYGFLDKNIKWVQKQELRKIPFVGKASEIAGHVFVDNSSTKTMLETIKKAEHELEDGISMVIFPEGARAKDGKMGRFKKGAYVIAKEMQLPIVPLTINGSYDVLRIGSTKMHFLKHLELVVHDPIETNHMTEDDIGKMMKETYNIIESDLWPSYKKNKQL